MLVITRRPNERIMIGDDIEVVVLQVSGRCVRIGVIAPKDVIVEREEIALKRRAEEQPR